MKTMNGIFGFVIALILFFSVAPATLGFMAFEHQGLFGQNVLIRHIDKEQWQIGYRFATTCPAEFRERENELKELITKSLHAWLQPLREEFPAAVITNKFNLRLLKDVKKGETDEQVLALNRQVHKELDTRITFTCEEGISFVVIDINFTPDIFILEGIRIDETMKAGFLHELGHAFGMGDTYVNPYNRDATRSAGGLNQTRGLQPTSLMAGPSGVHPPRELPYIKEDDKKGIIWLYKHIYEGQPLEDCFFPEYVYEEKPAGCRPKYPLIFEIKYGGRITTRVFLHQDQTVDVNEQDEHGLSALHYAVLLHWPLEVIELLLARANINPLLLDKQGRSPFGLAWEKVFGDLTEWKKREPEPLESIDIFPVLWQEQQQKRWKEREQILGPIDWWFTSLARILEQDPPVDVSAQDAQVLLGCALILNRLDFAAISLAHLGPDVSGPVYLTLDVNAQDASGGTLLHHAVIWNRPELVKELLAHKDIKPYISNEAGETPLALAHKLGLTSIAKLLTDHPRAFMAVEPRRKTMAVTWGELKRSN